MRVDFDQDLDSTGIGLRFELGDEIEGFGNHEAARAGFFDGIADGIKADDTDSGILKLIENAREVMPAFGMAHVDVDLPGGERGPEEMLSSASEPGICKRKAGPRAVDAEKIGLTRAVGEDAAQGQKHSGVGRIIASLVKIEKLR